MIPKGNEAAQVAGAGNVLPNNVLIPQGIQHVLINGKLYPIIQTANGTHLLIQQPVGQVQQPGSQIFTAQPINLGNLQQISGAPTAEQSQSSTEQTSLQQPMAAGDVPAQPASALGDLTSITQSILQDSESSMNSAMPVLPTTSSHTSNSHESNILSPRSETPTTNPATSPTNNSNTLSPQAQNLLQRVQQQIASFKKMGTLDDAAKKTLAQLEEAQKRCLSDMRRNQPPSANAGGVRQPPPQALANRFPNNGTMMPVPNPQPALTLPSHVFNQAVIVQPTLNPKELIVKCRKYRSTI